MTQTTDNVERWTYAGRRRSSSGALIGVYVDPSGVELAFKSPHRAIGATYDVTVTRLPTSVRAGIDGATFVEGPDRDDERVAGWEADDRAAYTADQARKAEARVKRDGVEHFGELTLNDVRQRLASAPRNQRTALLANVLAHLGA